VSRRSAARPGGRRSANGAQIADAVLLGVPAAVLIGTVAVSVAWWAGSGSWPLSSTSAMLRAAILLVRHPARPFGAVVPRGAPIPLGATLVLVVELLLVGLAALAGLLRCLAKSRPGQREVDGIAELRRAAKRRGVAKDEVRAGALVVGFAGRRAVATAAESSLLVVGPTRTGKTSGLVIPALLEWEGPVLATSVRADLVRATLARRVALGTTWIFDPSRSTDLPGASWDPLGDARDATSARRIADAIVRSAPGRSGGLGDGDFWFRSAAKLLAPLVLAAGISGAGMEALCEWLDQDDQDEPGSILEAAGEQVALRALSAFVSKDDRYRSSVLATAEVAVDVFAETGVLAGSGGPPIDLGRLVEGSSSSVASLFVIAPPAEQDRLRPLFTLLVSEALSLAYRRAASIGRPLDPRLLVMLDEAANIAPIADLDRLASTAAGEGIQLVSVWQDLAQIEARYATRWATVVSNHRARLVLRGVGDPGTLEHLSALSGEVWRTQESSTRDPRSGVTTVTSAPLRERRVTPAELHGLPSGHALFFESPSSPALVRLRPWFADRRLCRLAGQARSTSWFGWSRLRRRRPP